MTPDRDTAWDPVRLPRRLLLRSTVWTGVLAAGAGAITGCDGSDSNGRESPTPTPKPDPDLPLVTSALKLSRQLLDRYAATTSRYPELTPKLAPFGTRHRQHVKALSDGSAGPSVPPTPTPTPTPSPTATASASPTTAPVADSPASAVRDLIELEKSAASARSKGLLAARNPELARLLASIGACETVHAFALAEVAGG